tara:strand:+ start:650 stop:859 length:210 start_codon:yes stop_codon:yes gene_type:complete
MIVINVSHSLPRSSARRNAAFNERFYKMNAELVREAEKHGIYGVGARTEEDEEFATIVADEVEKILEEE